MSHEPALSPGAPTAPSVRVALKLPVATVNNGSFPPIGCETGATDAKRPGAAVQARRLSSRKAVGRSRLVVAQPNHSGPGQTVNRGLAILSLALVATAINANLCASWQSLA